MPRQYFTNIYLLVAEHGNFGAPQPRMHPMDACWRKKPICLGENNRAMRNKRRRDMMGSDSGDDMSYILVLQLQQLSSITGRALIDMLEDE